MTAPKCYCARPAAVRVVKKDTHNKGRAFFVCPRESKDKARCDFFKWLDAAEPTTARPPAKGHVSGGLRIAPAAVDRIPAEVLRNTSMLMLMPTNLKRFKVICLIRSLGPPDPDF